MINSVPPLTDFGIQNRTTNDGPFKRKNSFIKTSTHWKSFSFLFFTINDEIYLRQNQLKTIVNLILKWLKFLSAKRSFETRKYFLSLYLLNLFVIIINLFHSHSFGCFLGRIRSNILWFFRVTLYNSVPVPEYSRTFTRTLRSFFLFLILVFHVRILYTNRSVLLLLLFFYWSNGSSSLDRHAKRDGERG